MAVQNPYLTTDGDLNQAKRKRAGEVMAIDAVPKQTSFDVTNTPAGSVPGNPARAAQMQAQFNQPVSKGSSPLLAVQPAVGGGGGDQRPAIAGDSAGLQRMIGGSLSIAPAAIWEGAKNLGTDLQNTAYSLIDAEPVPRPGYPRTTQLAQEIAGGASAFSDANSNLLSSAKGGARDLVGAKQAPQPATPQQPASPTAAAASSGPAAAAQKPEAAAPIKTTANPATPAKPTVEPVPESPYFATGTDQIAARMNGSTPEFTNDPTAAAGARAMPAGGRGSPLLAPGVSNMADDVPLERRGSINNVGNGVGGFSQNTQGDAALALGRFERANQDREKMVQISRRGGIGEGGGRVTVVKDSSRTPTLQERQLARLEEREAQTEALRSQSQQSIMAGADELMTNQLNRQKTQQEITAGNTSAESQQRLEGLRAQMADTSLPEEQRQAAAQAYSALTISAADRYMTVQGGTNEGGGKDASKVFDRLTGREIGGAQSGQARTSVSMSEVEATAKARNMSADEVVAALKEKGVSVAR